MSRENYTNEKPMRILELFSGIGACSKAIERLGISHVIVDAVEFDESAIKSFNAVHNTNFPAQDICEWDKSNEELGGEIDLCLHGSPCFPGDTLVNTQDGLVPIKNVEVDDYVKDYKGTFRKVIKTMINKSDDIYQLKCAALGNNFKVTGNHPFYILRNGKYQWCKVEELTTSDYLCIPKNKLSEQYVWSGVQHYQNNHNKVVNNLPIEDERLWYIAGRYIGDGWIVRRKERNNNISGAKICCGKHKLKRFQDKIGDLYNYCLTEERTAYKLQFTNKELGTFLQQFGEGAINKHIPQEILDLDIKYLKPLLDGIMDSDGSISNNLYRLGSISEKLVYNVGELVLKIYNVPYHITFTKRKPITKIENRVVNQKDSFQVDYRINNEHNVDLNYTDENYYYSKIRGINKIDSETIDVYNLEVENTHTYCVNNVAVHNCTDYSLAGKQLGGDEGSGTRSSLMYESLRIIKKIKPKYVVWENVANLLSDKHKHNFNNYLIRMKEIGYKNYYRVLNSADFGVPQHRERVFTVSIRNDLDTRFTFPKPIPLTKFLKDVLEENVDEKYYISDKYITDALQEEVDKLEDDNDK